eukprot:TRINITY_DN6766_c1_g1_i1.p1 TRINITY_DN6766_c1_g1~~TRINITY_DN6766_c1_g1_i1.p1  ORF type:complete len:555 (-),score=139.41 TRINITY_DN6766_c1_g1_i1:90-1754(-)
MLSVDYPVHPLQVSTLTDAQAETFDPVELAVASASAWASAFAASLPAFEAEVEEDDAEGDAELQVSVDDDHEEAAIADKVGIAAARKDEPATASAPVEELKQQEGGQDGEGEGEEEESMLSSLAAEGWAWAAWAASLAASPEEDATGDVQPELAGVAAAAAACGVAARSPSQSGPLSCGRTGDRAASAGVAGGSRGCFAGCLQGFMGQGRRFRLPFRGGGHDDVRTPLNSTSCGAGGSSSSASNASPTNIPRRPARSAPRASPVPGAVSSAAAAEVEALADLGQFLEAERLLDALGDDAMVSDAAQLRLQAAAAREAVSTFTDLYEAAEKPDSGWDVWEGGAASLRYKYDWYTGALEVIGDIRVEMPAVQLWAVLREFDLFPTWSRAIESRLLEQFRMATEMYYVRSNPILPVFSQTEMYVERSYVDALSEHGLLLVLATTPPVEATEHRGVAIPAPGVGLNRILSKAEDAVRPLSPSAALYKVHRKVKTPFAYLPNSVVGKAASALVNGQLTLLQNITDTWDGGVHATRLHSGPLAGEYARLRSRLEAAEQST